MNAGLSDMIQFQILRRWRVHAIPALCVSLPDDRCKCSAAKMINANDALMNGVTAKLGVKYVRKNEIKLAVGNAIRIIGQFIFYK